MRIAADDLLQALRRRGIAVGLPERARLAVLAPLLRDASDDEVREALAATLVKDPRLRVAFDDEYARWRALYDHDDRPGPRFAVPFWPREWAPPVPPRRRRWRGSGLWLAIGLVALVAAGLWFAWPGAPPRTVPSPPQPNPDVSAPPVPRELPEAGRERFVPVDASLPPRAEWIPAVVHGARPEDPALALGAFAASVAALGLLWLRYSRRARLPRPLPLPAEGPAWLPFLPPPERGPRLLAPDDVRDLVFGVERFVGEDWTGRLDVPRTVAATARAAGVVQLVPEREVRAREVWLWQDELAGEPSLELVADDVEHVLARAGLDVRRGFFAGTPDDITWRDGDRFSPLDLEGRRASAIVAVLTDAHGLARALEPGAARARADGMLRALAEWPRLAFVDFGRGGDLQHLLRPYGIACMPPAGLPEFVGAGTSRRRGRPRPRARPGDVRALRAAAALAPTPLDAATVPALCEALGLPRTAELLDALAPGTALSAVRGEAGRRELAWLLGAEPLATDAPIPSASTLGRALAFWRERCRREAAARRLDESPLLPWDGTPAAQRLALEEALLALWDDPRLAAARLWALAGGGWRDEIRRRLGPWSGRRRGGGTGAFAAFPWSWESLDDKTAWLLQDLGLGRDLGARVVRALRLPARLWLALAAWAAFGLGSLAVAALARGGAAGALDPFAMVELPGGSFEMGSPAADLLPDSDESLHRVQVGAFAIGRHEVTRRLYRQVMRKAPKEWTEPDDDELPANWLTWLDAVSFCNALSTRTDLSAAYRIDGERVDPVPGASGYRLPTEAEWEYACRGGTTTAWSFGDDERLLGDYAWFGGNSESPVHAVGQKRPNPFGLHDVHGNVWEWCQDRYGEYDAGVARDPQGSADGFARVLRGGSAWFVPRNLRSAVRDWSGPSDWDRSIGFRCVRAPRRQP
jgi:formylglycine-generating enzyme required for sulfatase activity